MTKLKAIWYTAMWMGSLIALTIRYGTVWEPGGGLMSAQEAREFDERMKTGPLRYEYARVEALKEKAIALWMGDGNR